MTPKQILANVMAHLALTVESEFVPWSKSRSFKAGANIRERNLNWKITLLHKGQKVITTDYSAGIAHCPSYPKNGRITTDIATQLESETERGKQTKIGGFTGHAFLGDTLKPDACDVMYGLLVDAEAIDHPSFEDWASSFGYDTDSRKAEACYRACLETALAIRAAIGEVGLTMLREACQDY